MSAQALVALRSANAVRMARAELMRQLRTGVISFADLDLDDPCLQTMRVFDLLRCLSWKARPGSLTTTGQVHRQATFFPRRLLYDFRAREGTALSDLSPGRKEELKRMVAERCPSQRVAA